MKKSIGISAAAMLGAVAMTACTTNLSTARKHYDQGSFATAATEIQAIKPKNKDTIWVMLERGTMNQSAGRWYQSTGSYEEAWRLVEIVWELGDLEKAGRKIDLGALMTGEDLRDYEGTPYDLVLLKMNLALSYAMSGRLDLAMVTCRGMIDLQTIAWKEQIGQDQVEKKVDGRLASTGKQHGAPTLTFDEVVNKPEFRNARRELGRYSGSLVADNQFPSGYYLGWIISMANGNTGEAQDFQKALQRSLPNSTVTNAITNASGLGNNIYVFFDNGLAPIRRDGSVRFPLPMGRGIVAWVKVALPVLQFRPRGRADRLSIAADGKVMSTQRLDSVEAVEAWWFQEHLAEIWGRPIVSAVMKTVASYAAQRAADESESEWDDIAAAIGTGIWSEATQPDLRNWSSLPADHQGLVLPRPASGQLALGLLGPGGSSRLSSTVNLGGNGPILLYVRSVNDRQMVAFALPLASQGPSKMASLVTSTDPGLQPQLASAQEIPQ